MKKYDVVALGELLIDFTENGLSIQGNPLLEANPGGAPCNVLAMLNNHKKKTAFVGKVGNDTFGKQLESKLIEVGIDTAGLVKSEEVRTTLAFVHTLDDGDREFSFYRNPGADMMLDVDEVDSSVITSTRVFHFGSLSLTDEPVRSATKNALNLAKKSGALITYDPNLREPLWRSLDLAKEQIAYGMSMCDVMKISDNEVLWFTGLDDYDEAIKRIQSEYPNIKLICLTLGKEGSRAYMGSRKIEVPGVIQPNTIETTGAGDTFCACMINFILDNGLDLSDEKLSYMLKYANIAASIITTRKGALSVMPTIEEINEYL